MSRAPTKCEKCGRELVGTAWARCYDCGKICCRACKGAGYHLCHACWNTPDGREADQNEKEAKR